MGESKHTPGPWRYITGKNAGRYEPDDGRRFDLFPSIKIGRAEDVIHGGSTLDECEANARLIAAAPKMLEAHTESEMDANAALSLLTQAHVAQTREERTAALALLKARLHAIESRSRAAIKAATGGEP